MIFVNSFDPDHAQQNVGPDLDPNRLTLFTVFLREFFEKVNFEIKSAEYNKSMKNYPTCKELTLKAPITTAADDKFCDILPNFWKK